MHLHQRTRAARAHKSANMFSANMVSILPKVLNAFSSANIELETAEAVPVDPSSTLAHEQESEGGMMRLETLTELNFFNSSISSSNV